MKKFTYRINPNTQKALKGEGKETDDDYEYGYLTKMMRPFFINDPDFVQNKSSKKVDFTNELNNSKIKNRINHLVCLRQKKNLSNFIPNNYLPESFNKNNKIDDNTFWFVKPNIGRCGQGIIITKDPKEYVDKNYVIQKQNIPNLMDKRIWTVRIYIIAYYSNNKLSFWMTNNGIVRKTLREYEKGSSDSYQLITNDASIERYTNGFSNKLPNNIMKKIIRKLLSSVDNYEIRIKNIKKMMKESKYKLKENFEPSKEDNYSHHILGLDIIFDKNEKPYVLEINTRPAFCVTPIKTNYNKGIKNGFGILFSPHQIKKYEYILYKKIFLNFIKRPLENKEPISDNFLFEI